MMNALREQASGWVAKFFLALLVLSFGAWGIGDIFTHAGRDRTVAEVGGTKISRAEFDMEYQRKVNELRSMMGSSFSPELLKGLHMEMQVLSSLVDQLLIRKEAAALGISVGDSDIQDAIRKNNDFKGESGKFDLRTFQRVLESNNISEKRYYDALRMNMSAELMLAPLSKQKLYPSGLVDGIVRHALQRRTAELVLIPANAKLEEAAPSEAELNAYYEDTKNNFTAPEMREGKYIDIRFEDMMKTTQVPAEDIAKAYRDRIEDYRQPETRDVNQLLYEDEASAQKAYELLQKNTPFAQIVKKQPPSNSEKTSLGFMRKAELPASAATAVFDLKAGEFTKPISSDFGWHIFQVKSIKPEGVASLEEVTPKIEKELKQHTVEEAIYALTNKLEDALAAGTAFDTAAKDVGLTVKTTPALTKQGTDVTGKKVEGIPAYSNFVQTLFNTDEKNQSAMTIADDGSYFVIETTKVTPERIKPLEEVKAEVTAQLVKQQHLKQLHAKAVSIAKDLKAGKPVTEAINASGVHGVERINAGTLTRSSTTTGADAGSKHALDKSLVEEIFALQQQGQSTDALPTNDGGFAIAILKSVILATPQQVKDAAGERATAEAELTKQYDNEIYEQYMSYLRDKYDVAMYRDRLPQDADQAGNEQ